MLHMQHGCARIQQLTMAQRHEHDQIMQSCAAQKHKNMTSAICTSRLLAVGERVRAIYSTQLPSAVSVSLRLMNIKKMVQRRWWIWSAVMASLSAKSCCTQHFSGSCTTFHTGMPEKLSGFKSSLIRHFSQLTPEKALFQDGPEVDVDLVLSEGQPVCN